MEAARRTGASPVLLHALGEILVDDADVPSGVLVPRVTDDPGAEARVQHVLDGMRREQPAGARREPLRVAPVRDHAVGVTGGPALERARDRRDFPGDLLRNARRRVGPVPAGHVADREPALGTDVLRLADVDAKLVREELRHAADHCEHEPAGGSRDIEALGDAREAHMGIQALQRLALDADVARPTV